MLIFTAREKDLSTNAWMFSEKLHTTSISPAPDGSVANFAPGELVG